MEEDDHDELLQFTDDDSWSENEDQCMPIDAHDEPRLEPCINFSNHSRYEFIFTKIALILSTLFMLILLPAYIESINVKSDVYNMLWMNTGLATVTLTIFMGFVKVFFRNSFLNVKMFTLPLRFIKMIVISILYTISGFMSVYAFDRKRVLCHLQDPIKGIVLVFSLLYYFIFCRKFMGLQRIFSATTIIVGLFIAVDYGLCDEFRCRGYERQKVTDDTGHWPWKIHTIWTVVYILGLGIFASYFTILDQYLLATNRLIPVSVNVNSSFLNTVSRFVSYGNSNITLTNNILARNRPPTTIITKSQSALHLAMWLHVFVLVFTFILFWTDLIPSIGRGSSIEDLVNATRNGVICHFKPERISLTDTPECGNVFLFSWSFLFAYVLFSITSIRFMMLAQSAVYTMATMTGVLPLLGIWWALFQMVPLENGGVMIEWAPAFTGELICSLLGLPIIFIGLFLLCKAHFNDYHITFQNQITALSRHQA